MEKTGTMPLELTYRAMKNGSVQIEIYDKRSQPDAIIDPINVFDRNLSVASTDTLSSAEEKFLIHRKIVMLSRNKSVA